MDQSGRDPSFMSRYFITCQEFYFQAKIFNVMSRFFTQVEIFFFRVEILFKARFFFTSRFYLMWRTLFLGKDYCFFQLGSLDLDLKIWIFRFPSEREFMKSVTKSVFFRFRVQLLEIQRSIF